MIIPKEDRGEKSFDIMVYHVTDRYGTHRFLTMNSLSCWFSEGRDGFERVLARQYPTFEWVGSTPMNVTMTDPPKYRFLDPDGKEQLWDRISVLMDTFQNSSDRLERWLPEQGAKRATPETIRSPWRPMSTLKQAMGGKVDLDRIAVAFVNKDVSEMVKPEFVDAVRERGAARLRELKEDVRRVVEPSLLRATEGSAEASDRQGGPTALEEGAG